MSLKKIVIISKEEYNFIQQNMPEKKFYFQ